jgi:hypothetical protein
MRWPTHNNNWKNVDPIDVAMVKCGLEQKFIHPTDARTKYPRLTRKEAVEEWLSRNGEIDRWIAIDDVLFLDEGDPRMILVDPYVGLNWHHMEPAIIQLGGQGCPVMLI